MVVEESLIKRYAQQHASAMSHVSRLFPPWIEWLRIEESNVQWHCEKCHAHARRGEGREGRGNTDQHCVTEQTEKLVLRGRVSCLKGADFYSPLSVGLINVS